MKLDARKNLVFLFLLSLCIIFLVSPVLFRNLNSDKYLIGDKSYFYLRLAGEIKENGIIPNEDYFSYGGREFRDEWGWPYLLSFNPEFLSFYLPIILGILSFILFYIILNKFDYKLGVVSSLLFIISPSFIYLFSVSNKFSVSVFLSLLAIYLNLNNRKILSLLCIPLIGFFSVLASILMLLIYAVYNLYKKEHWHYLLITLFLTLTVIYIQFGIISFKGLFFIKNNFALFLQNMISDFGGNFGIGIFMLLISFIGVFFLWKNKYKHSFAYLLFIILFLLSYYFDFVIFYLNLLVAVLAGFALIQLYEMKWEEDFIKKLVIFILICGLLFSSISFINRLVADEPKKELQEGLYYLSRQPDDGVVFSHYSKGNLINYAGKKNLMDSNFFNAPDLYKRNKDSETLLHSQNITVTFDLIEKYNIEYIFIDREMISGLVWYDDNIELLFILENDKGFKKVFDNDYVKIWKVLND